MKKQLLINVLFFLTINVNQNCFGFKLNFLDLNKNRNKTEKSENGKPLTVSDYISTGRRWIRREVTTPLAEITGIKPEGDGKWVWTTDNLDHIRTDTHITLRLFGLNLDLNGSVPTLQLRYTNNAPNGKDPQCTPYHESPTFDVNPLDTHTSYVNNFFISNAGTYYICYRHEGSGDGWYYVTSAGAVWNRIVAADPMIPFAIQVVFIIVLLCMSGLFSGLNLGLMALDKNELKVIERCGTEQEKNYAKAIAPVRKRGNYLLCTLLLGNVLVNSMLTIFLDDLTSGVIAVVGSTLSIVVFGEIIPQALCSRHGLAVGARTVWLTYIFMVVTCPLSYPISKILDKVLGEEIGNVYDRERLMEYIRVTKDHNRLEADEVNIISGALKLSKIKVIEIMTPISDVFMLAYNEILDFQTITRINDSGYSRIPIYEGERNNVVGILHAKDLAFTDTEQKTPIKSLIEFYKHPLYFVYEDVTLDVMLNEFKQGKSHMAFVRKILDDGVNDPVYELAGVVTLEDVIEELIQAEINDETDVISDNRRKQKRKEVVNRPNYSDFVRFDKECGGDEADHNTTISAQLALAAYRYLSAFVEPFTTEYLSEKVLKRLMDKKPFYEMKVNPAVMFDEVEDVPTDHKLYVLGKASNYFILILEGRVKVIIGKENQCYEAGPFNYFGVSALKLTSSDNERVTKSTSLGRLSIIDVTQQQSNDAVLKSSSSTACTSGYRASIVDSSNSFIPDFTVFCIEDTVYLKVERNLYLAAIRATLIERQRESLDPEDEGILHFGLDHNTESSVNLLTERVRSNSELQTNTSANKLQSSGANPSGKPSPSDSSRTVTSSPDALPPKYDELSNSINNKNNLNESLGKNNINERNSSPTDEKSHLI